MFNNSALDVFIGLLGIFLLHSRLACIIMEIIAKRLGMRQITSWLSHKGKLLNSEFICLLC
jgi:hypothetical protein